MLCFSCGHSLNGQIYWKHRWHKYRPENHFEIVDKIDIKFFKCSDMLHILLILCSLCILGGNSYELNRWAINNKLQFVLFKWNIVPSTLIFNLRLLNCYVCFMLNAAWNFDLFVFENSPQHSLKVEFGSRIVIGSWTYFYGGIKTSHSRSPYLVTIKRPNTRQ